MPAFNQKQTGKIGYPIVRANAMKRKLALALIWILLIFITILFQQTLCADTSRCISLCDDLYLSPEYKRQWEKCITDCIETASQYSEYEEEPEGYSSMDSIEDDPYLHFRSHEAKYEFLKKDNAQQPLMFRIEKNLYKRCANGDRQACQRLLFLKQKNRL